MARLDPREQPPLGSAVVYLGDGVTAESQSRVPTPFSADGKIVEVSAKPGTLCAYKLIGCEPTLRMGCARPYILVESDRELGVDELREIARDQSAAGRRQNRLLPPGIVSIAWRCPESRPPAGASTQAQADSQDWSMKKWRETIAAKLGRQP